MVIYWILFGLKRTFFSTDFPKKCVGYISQEICYSFFNIGPIGPIFGINVPWDIVKLCTWAIFEILIFRIFTGRERCKNVNFLAKSAYFAKKWTFLHLSRPIKIGKIEISKIAQAGSSTKFHNIPRNIYTKNWTNRTNIEEGVGNFLRSWGTHFFEKIGQKTGPFQPEQYSIFDHWFF